MMDDIYVGVIVNGATGRMGKLSHSKNSLLAINNDGLYLDDGRRVKVDALLVGRDPIKLKALSDETGFPYKTLDGLDDALADPKYSIYFDTQSTDRRVPDVLRAIAAGKHIYCEKPSADSLEGALQIYKAAVEKGVKNGVVQDKLFLPGLIKLDEIIKSGKLGKIVGAEGQFGYWVFDGYDPKESAQRPSWNYRKETGGSITTDMLAHWRYVIDNLLGPITNVTSEISTRIVNRIDEKGQPYKCNTDDTNSSIFTLANGLIVPFFSSWEWAVRGRDLFQLQVDGTEGSAIATLRECDIQPRNKTPRAIWGPDTRDPNDYNKDWDKFDIDKIYQNAFRAQWELFLRHVLENKPFPYDLREGAKGVQLSTLSLESAAKGQRMYVLGLPIYTN